MRCLPFTRRRFLHLSSAALVASLGNLVHAKSATSASKSFDARNAMRFVNMPDTAPLGLPSIHVVYASKLWRKNASRAEPDVDHIDQMIRSRLRSTPPDLAVIDIEHWHLSGLPPLAIKRNIERYLTVVRAFRHHLPETRLGFYSMVPIREYWAPVKNDVAALEEWRRANQQLQPLAAAVDIIFPSLYTFYDQPEQWQRYAIGNVAEARQYGKPVYPFIWPQFHDSGAEIPFTFWRQQLETVYAEADGLVIWSPARGRPTWNPSAPWWQATTDFLQSRLKEH